MVVLHLHKATPSASSTSNGSGIVLVKTASIDDTSCTQSKGLLKRGEDEGSKAGDSG